MRRCLGLNLPPIAGAQHHYSSLEGMLTVKYTKCMLRLDFPDGDTCERNKISNVGNNIYFTDEKEEELHI